ncbi:hypothetical protein ARMA_3052 [Ardenticatena maritima]|uniref:Uncharacterized protein n=1 Tax=Ardenticatena maritima TaxID=872965 RepID=A0A0M8KBX9_9CHLR|nr:hypothetical protein ARMA_3052 [Ardenticatena maritima]
MLNNPSGKRLHDFAGAFVWKRGSGWFPVEPPVFKIGGARR